MYDLLDFLVDLADDGCLELDPDDPIELWDCFVAALGRELDFTDEEDRDFFYDYIWNGNSNDDDITTDPNPDNHGLEEDDKITVDCGDEGDASNSGTTVHEHPVALFDGDKLETVTDVTVKVSGPDFAIRRMYTSNPSYSGADLVGNGWTLDCFAYLVEATLPNCSGALNLVGSKYCGGPPPPWSRINRYVTFPCIDTDLYEPDGAQTMYIEADATLNVNESGGTENVDVFRVVNPGKYEMDYYRDDGAAYADFKGLLLEERDWYGNRRRYVYGKYGTSDDVPRLDAIRIHSNSGSTLEAQI